jgi:hypothetical protein
MKLRSSISNILWCVYKFDVFTELLSVGAVTCTTDTTDWQEFLNHMSYHEVSQSVWLYMDHQIWQAKT